MGKFEDQKIYAAYTEKGMRSLHRAHLLDELVKLMPTNRCHFGKRLVGIKDNTKSADHVLLTFADGSSATADAVIGADGLHGAVRSSIMAPSDPAIIPVFAGCVVFRRLVPMEVAIEALGVEYTASPHTLWGWGKSFVSYPISGGTTFNLAVVVNKSEWDDGDRIGKATVEDRAYYLEGWGKLGQGFSKVHQRIFGTMACLS